MNIGLGALLGKLRPSTGALRKRNPRTNARILVSLLLLANFAAALWAFKPWAGSIEDLDRQTAGLRQQIRAKEQDIARLQRTTATIETARGDGDRFIQDHILSARTLSSTLVDELAQTAKKAGIKQREARFGIEPIEGSDTMSRMVVTGYYEGTYADLMHFLNLLDRSPRLLIIESLTAAPQTNGMTLNIAMKLNAFARDDGTRLPATAGAPAAGQQERAGL